MTRTVDLVVAGDGRAALAAAAEAVQRGRRVLVVIRFGDARAVRLLRRRVCGAAHAENIKLTVMTNAEVVCVDGVEGVEAVVIRRARTGRLCAVNASEFLSCDGSTWRKSSAAGNASTWDYRKSTNQRQTEVRVKPEAPGDLRRTDSRRIHGSTDVNNG